MSQVTRVCSVGGCSQTATSIGMCGVHYSRWYRHGHTDVVRRQTTHERLSQYLNEGSPDECWLWGGPVNASGYGQTKFHGVNKMAHRVIYEERVGPIPEGALLDHRCHNTLCVNPAHLRLVTHKQNMEHLKGPQANNTTGYRGVYKNGSGYIARVTHNRNKYNLGTYRTAEEAAQVALQARKVLYTHDDYDEWQGKQATKR